MPHANPIDAVKLQRHRFLGFSFALADLLIELDPAGRVVFAAGACQHLFGQDDSALKGQLLAEHIAKADRPLVKQLLHQLDTGHRIPPVEIAVERIDGTFAKVVFCGYALPHEPTKYLALSAAQRFQALTQQSEGRDPATGLHTTQSFGERLRELIEGDEESVNELTMTFMELEGLDRFEQSASPSSYQDVISGVAAFLRLRSFEGDSAGWVADGRFGLVTDATVDHSALADELLEAVPEARQLTASLHSQALRPAGVSAQTSARTLIHTLQRFQSEGLTDEVRADPGAQFRSLLKQTLGAIERFQEIIERDHISLAYQPIVELASGQVHRYEVLARLPDGGSPFESVSLGESIGMIATFDLTVCRKALADLQPDGPAAGLTLSVNLSAQSLQEEVFVDALELLLQDHGQLRRRLSFEVTESAEITDFAAVNAAIQRLRALGCQVALDDFGAGNATFRYLQAFEVDSIKMDGAYVRAMVESPRDYAIVKGLAGICQDLNLTMVAEMIETRQQADLLSELGVRFGQGYLFGGPKIGRPVAPKQAPGTSPTVSVLRGRRQGTSETWA